MKTKNSDQDWLKEAPKLTKISKKNPFSVPYAYFESLNDDLKTLATLESLPLKNEEDYPLPLHYFKQLPDKINDRAAIEATWNLSPETAFQVPDNYFDSLKERIKSRIEKEKESVVIKKRIPSWIPYSAAASILFVLGLSLYFNSSGYVFNKQLSSVPDYEIINYLQIHSTVNDNQYLIENITEDGLQQVSIDLSAEDIEQYINSTSL